MIVGMAFREPNLGVLAAACVFACAVMGLWRNGLIPQWIGWGLILAGCAMTLCIGLLSFRRGACTPHTAEKIR